MPTGCHGSVLHLVHLSAAADRPPSHSLHLPHRSDGSCMDGRGGPLAVECIPSGVRGNQHLRVCVGLFPALPRSQRWNCILSGHALEIVASEHLEGFGYRISICFQVPTVPKIFISCFCRNRKLDVLYLNLTQVNTL